LAGIPVHSILSHTEEERWGLTPRGLRLSCDEDSGAALVWEKMFRTTLGKWPHESARFADAIPRRAFVAVAIVLWIALVGLGARTLLNYENAAGAPTNAPLRWPSNSRIAKLDSKFTLILLAHPNCPCTRASLAELEILEAQLQGKLKAFVVFSKPAATAAEVQSSDLWRKTASIPDVVAIFDDHGTETRIFGGQTSGQAILYDSRGHLVFSGGITSARGHQGDNAGVDMVIASVRGEAKVVGRTPTFGCSLHNPDAQQLREGSLWKKQ
jgi:hypothetical protein